MTYDTAFVLANSVALVGWLLLLVSPWIPVWSDRIAGTVLPILLSFGYLILLIMPSEGGGGFNSLAGVMELFSYKKAVLAGWVHYLAFDLFIGAWICRMARSKGIKFGFVVPCLPLVLMFGPVGYLAFNVVSGLTWTRTEMSD